MKFLPVVERELRVAARKSGTFWMRSVMAALVLAGAAVILVFARDQPPRVFGPVLFYVLAGIALVACLVAGAVVTSDCLSEEKREGTLGLLFLTDLKGYDVVAGKLVANSLGSLYGLLAIVPMLGLPLLMGGVAPAEFGRVSLVLLNTLFFSLTAGIVCSSYSRTAREAAVATIALIVLFTALIPALGGLLEWQLRKDDLHEPFLFASPVFSFYSAIDARAKGNVDLFVWSLAAQHGAAWLFLALACYVTPRTWREKALRPTARLAQPVTEGAIAFRTRLLAVNPFYWLAARSRRGPVLVWSALTVLAALWMWGAFEFKRDWFSEGIFVATALALNSFLKIWVAAEACRPLAEERKTGSLELLLTTPLSVRQVIEGHRLALARQFLWPCLLVLLAEFAMMISGMAKMGGDSPATSEPMAVWISLWILGLILFAADLVALHWMGMWMGLASRNPKRAFIKTTARVLVLPWAAFLLFLLVVALGEITFHRSPGGKTFIAVWFVLALAADIGFSIQARYNLVNNFRVAAALRYQSGVSLWKRVFRSRAN